MKKYFFLFLSLPLLQLCCKKDLERDNIYDERSSLFVPTDVDFSFTLSNENVPDGKIQEGETLTMNFKITNTTNRTLDNLPYRLRSLENGLINKVGKITNLKTGESTTIPLTIDFNVPEGELIVEFEIEDKNVPIIKTIKTPIEPDPTGNVRIKFLRFEIVDEYYKDGAFTKGELIELIPYVENTGTDDAKYIRFNGMYATTGGQYIYGIYYSKALPLSFGSPGTIPKNGGTKAVTDGTVEVSIRSSVPAGTDVTFVCNFSQSTTGKTWTDTFTRRIY